MLCCVGCLIMRSTKEIVRAFILSVLKICLVIYPSIFPLPLSFFSFTLSSLPNLSALCPSSLTSGVRAHLPISDVTDRERRKVEGDELSWRRELCEAWRVQPPEWCDAYRHALNVYNINTSPPQPRRLHQTMCCTRQPPRCTPLPGDCRRPPRSRTRTEASPNHILRTVILSARVPISCGNMSAVITSPVHVSSANSTFLGCERWFTPKCSLG